MIFPDAVIIMLEPVMPRRVWYRDYYLQSKHWRSFKRRAKEHYGNKCARCFRHGSFVMLDVHHLTYARLWSERLEDVQLLCRDCHKLEHPVLK